MKVILTFLAFIPWSSWGHEAHAHEFSWNWDPLILFTLTLLSGSYGLGVVKLKKKGEASLISPFKIFSFILNLFFLIMALLSPIDIWSDDLQSVHMIQHMILMVLAAPFFVLSAPLYVLLWSLPLQWRKGFTPLYRWLYGYKSGWYFLWQPFLLWGLFALTLWVWHLPRLYEAALLDQRVHDLQHLSFFIAACLFWRILLDPIHRFKLNRGIGVFYLFATTLHATLLGVFMTLSPRLWYGLYLQRTQVWNLSPLEDQQLAGLIMWMPACMVYVVVTIVIFLQWMKEDGVKSPAHS